MDVLFWGVVIGFIGYFIGKSKAESDVRTKIKTEIIEYSGKQSDKDLIKALKIAGDFISREEVPQTTQARTGGYQPVTSVSQAPEPKAEPSPGYRPVTTAASPAATTHYAHHYATKPVDNISLLLYFGAFLMIAGVGLFVGLSDFSGFVKTVAVLLLAGVFYVGGLYLYQNNQKLRPVGITLTAIGLISLPLIGVTAYAYLNGQISPQVIWFVTSAACLGLYTFAILKIRQSFIGYLAVFMCLSLWMSIVSVFDAPVYIFGWAAVVLSMLYVLAAKRWSLWRELEEPLNISASILVPASLVMVILFGAGHISLMHQGITVLLAAAFYAQACWLSTKENERFNLFIVANSLLALATGMIAYDWSNSLAATAAWLSGVSSGQLLIGAWLKGKLAKNWLQGLSWITAVSMFTAALVAAGSGDWVATAWLIAWQFLVHSATALYIRSTAHMGLGLIDALALPFVIGFLAISPALSAEIVAAIYIALGLALMVAARFVNKIAPNYRQLTLIAYASAWAIAWLVGNLGVATGAPSWAPTTSTLAVASAALLAAYYEKRSWIVYAATTAGFIGAFQWLTLQSLTADYLIAALVIGGSGAAMYLVGKLHEQRPKLTEYWLPWSWSGLTFLYLGSIYSTSGAYFTPGQTIWAGATTLAIAGAITSFESYRTKEKIGVYFGYAVVLAALQFMMHQLGVVERQVYWYMWAAYALAIAYLEKLPASIYIGAALALVGLGQGISQHVIFNMPLISILLGLLAVAYYGVGKIHESMLGQNYKKLTDAWTVSGISSLFVTASIPFWWSSATVGNELVNAMALMAAGAALSYEAYRLSNRYGRYVGGGVALLGLQWLMHLNNITEFQVYSHMWALYFALLAWLSFNEKRDNKKDSFTVTALVIQTLPLASQALSGDAGYGLLLLVESVAIMAFGLLINYKLVSRWGLIVGALSVLYQLRDYQFFTLLLLGAGVIGFGVYMLMRSDKRKG